ncbi:reverse transcriptase domain-containing protein [Tanacetum coccineum]
MDDEPMWAADRVVALTPGSVITIPETANKFAIKRNHLTLIKGNQFDGRIKTDPHKYIHEFLKICDLFKYRDTENEAVRLMMFPLSLTREAKIWLDELNEGNIETWDELRTAFISRFFSPVLVDRLLGEIRAFSQHENKTITDAWLRMKEMLRNCHGHNLSKGNIIKIFYPGLNETTQEALNSRAGAENMLVEVGKFTFPADFIIIEMEEDKEDFDALLDEGSKILHSIDGTILEQKLFAEFDEFIAMTTDINSESESDTEESSFEKITLNTDYKIKTSLEEPPSDLELKPLPDNLEYVFLEEPSFLPVIISSQLSEQNKSKLVSVLKRHKKAFAWKTTDIPEICPPFCKHKIQLLDDKKPIIVHTDHSALRHLFKKQDAKPRLIRWILLLQEFDIEIKDRKGTKNVAADHLSQIEKDETSDDSEVDDNFPGETLMGINTNDNPWFADFENYLVSDIIPKGMTYQQKIKFFSDLKNYFWEEPYLFKVCSDGMIRRSVSRPETRIILDQCHHEPTGGHYGPTQPLKKVFTGQQSSKKLIL